MCIFYHQWSENSGFYFVKKEHFNGDQKRLTKILLDLTFSRLTP